MVDTEKKGEGKGAGTGTGTESPQQARSKPAAEQAEKAFEGVGRVLSAVGRVIPEDLSRKIDEQVAEVPPAGLLGLAATSFVVSGALALFRERKGWANFFGMWVPSLLFLTIYAKLVKLERTGAIRQVPTVH